MIPPLNRDKPSPQQRCALSRRNRLLWVPWVHTALQDGIAGPVTMTTAGSCNFQPEECPEYRTRLPTTLNRTAFVGTSVSEAWGLPGLGLPPAEREHGKSAPCDLGRQTEKGQEQLRSDRRNLQTQGCQSLVPDPSGCRGPRFFYFSSSELPAYSPEFLSSEHRAGGAERRVDFIWAGGRLIWAAWLRCSQVCEHR